MTTEPRDSKVMMTVSAISVGLRTRMERKEDPRVRETTRLPHSHLTALPASELFKMIISIYPKEWLLFDLNLGPICGIEIVTRQGNSRAGRASLNQGMDPSER